MATREAPPPRTVVTSKPYEKDAKRVRSRGKDMARLVAIVEALRYRSHSIRGTATLLLGETGGAIGSAMSNPTGCSSTDLMRRPSTSRGPAHTPICSGRAGIGVSLYPVVLIPAR